MKCSAPFHANDDFDHGLHQTRFPVMVLKTSRRRGSADIRSVGPRLSLAMVRSNGVESEPVATFFRLSMVFSENRYPLFRTML